ncbi:MAG: hypothetical protein M1817_005407 [Caeruleum heppii]|nr:MAG: hypothetical protein M1817_005407 [Caeruleum heppii]
MQGNLEGPEQEPSLIEYARFHGLTSNHLAVDPLSSASLQPPWTSLIAAQDDPPDPPTLDSLASTASHERLSVGRDAVLLLASSRRPPSHIDEHNIHTLTYQRIQDAKVELPLLATDHESDLYAFGPQIVPDLHHHGLPLENLQQDEDEGMSWPEFCHDRLEAQKLAVATEKFQGSRESLLLLQSCMKDFGLGKEEDLDHHPECEKKRPMLFDPVTPPLMPSTPAMSPYVPSSTTGHLDLLSDRTSPTTAELDRVNALLIGEDALRPPEQLKDDGNSGNDALGQVDSLRELHQLYGPPESDANVASSPPRAPVPAAHGKVEGPLTPPWPIKAVSGTVDPSGAFRSPFEGLEGLPSLIATPSTQAHALSEDRRTLEASMGRIGESVKRKIEEEQLQEADSTKRVAVPVMDFALPVPPWKQYLTPRGRQDWDESELSRQRRLLPDVYHCHFRKASWPGTTSIEHSLQWAPFPLQYGKVALDERIEGNDSTLEPYIGDAKGEDINSSALLWKPDGLRLLDEIREDDEGDGDDGEDALERGSFEDRASGDLQSLLRKRKLEMQELEELTTLAERGSPPYDPVKFDLGLCRPTGTAPMTTISTLRAKPSKKPKTSLSFSRPQLDHSLLHGTFSAKDALSTFMDLRGETAKKTETKPSPSTTSIQVTAPTSLKNTTKSDSKAEHKPPTRTKPAIPLPDIDTSAAPHQIIISTSFFLLHRRLFRILQTLLPTTTFIERDLSPRTNLKPNPSTTTSPRCMGPPPRPKTTADNPLQADDEADLLLSPSTGAILTTSQKIKQRSLPGQTARSFVTARVARVAARYERLIVLVSEGLVGGDSEDMFSADDSRSHRMNDRDCDALVEFTAFTAALDTDVTVLYVGGGERELAHWAAGVAVRYGDPEGQTTLIEDETLWESFLRTAGLNAFAAQAVLGALKPPDADESRDLSRDSSSPRHFEDRQGGASFGLAAFVRMSCEERTRRFEGLMGGRRVLGRVGQVVDGSWG